MCKTPIGKPVCRLHVISIYYVLHAHIVYSIAIYKLREDKENIAFDHGLNASNMCDLELQERLDIDNIILEAQQFHTQGTYSSLKRFFAYIPAHDVLDRQWSTLGYWMSALSDLLAEWTLKDISIYIYLSTYIYIYTYQNKRS